MSSADAPSTRTPVTLPSEKAAALEREQAVTVNDFLVALTPELQQALPKGLDADRMTRLAFTAVRKTPRLAQCTRESFAGALLTAAALGLDPGLDNEAHLVPYADRRRGVVECQLIVGYGGMVKHFWNHPLARGLDADAVHERDDFDYRRGTDPFLRHKPALGYRGEIICYYAVAHLEREGFRFLVLSPEEVRALRRGKVGPSGDIPDPEHWMERKTVLRQLLKLLPKSRQLAAVIAVDEQSGTELLQRLPQTAAAALPAAPAAPQAPAAAPVAVEPEPVGYPSQSPEPAAAARPPGGSSAAAATPVSAPAPSPSITPGPASTPGSSGPVAEGSEEVEDAGVEAPPPQQTQQSARQPAQPSAERAQPPGRRPAQQTARPAQRPTQQGRLWQAQRRRLFARLDELGVDRSDEERKHVVGVILGRPVDSFDDLSRNDLSLLLDSLEPLVTHADLWAYLDRIESGAEQ